MKYIVSFAKETYNCKDPTSRSHPIAGLDEEVAATSRLLKIIGLFCKRDLSKRRYSANETYNFKEPTSGAHFIAMK